MKITMQDDELQQQEWERLYEGLLYLLANFGINDSHGNGEYYIVEENEGGPTQTVKIFELPLINPNLIGEVQREMKDLKMEWEVKFMLETYDPRYTGTSESITIFKDRVEERWDKQRLKKEVGDTFMWTT